MATLHRAGRRRAAVVLREGSRRSGCWTLCRTADEAPTAAPDRSTRDRVAARPTSSPAGAARARLRGRTSTPTPARTRERACPARSTFIGLQAMLDPPDPRRSSRCAHASSAGIDVKMITGDHAATGAAIADAARPPRRPRRRTAPCSPVPSSTRCRPTSYPDAVERASVFARVSPEQKLRLVEGAPGPGSRRGHDRRRGERCPGAATGRHRRGHGPRRHRGGARRPRTWCSPTTTSPPSRRQSRRAGASFDNLTKFIVWTLPTNMGEGLVILDRHRARRRAADPAGADPLDQHDDRRSRSV